MHRSQEPTTRRRSAFAASFLSLLFPGLGHAYAGAWGRALGFAAAPLLSLSLLAGLAFSLRLELLGILLQPAVLGLILVADVVLLLYRVAAAVDAWRVTAWLNAAEVSGGRLGRPRLRPGLLSIAGLAAVLVVMAGGHLAVAYYDLQASDLVNCVFDESGQATCPDSATTGIQGAGGPANSSTAPEGPGASGAPATAAPGVTAAPNTTLPPWNGRDRLNILLIGADQRPNDNTFNTDTLITVSIDPVTKQVAMFSLPRDTVDVPLPPGPARAVFGTAYAGKINSLWTQAKARPDLWPGTDRQRGYEALKQTLGYLYQLDIRWYVAVNFEGFRRVIDTLGGVTVNVQTPVVDDRFPGDSGRLTRIYIPAGIQHMNGSQALAYARSRHGSSDFDRGQRQQRVLLSLKEQADYGRLIARLPDLVAALKTAVKTDIPVGQLPQLLQLASSVDSASIRSYVFAPPLYGTEGYPNGVYKLEPNVARIRAAVSEAFQVDPAREANREKVSAENATAWVLNGSGERGQASRIAAWLAFQGLNASAPNQKPDSQGLSATRIAVYNGAEARLPATIKLLEAAFGVPVVPVTDPAVKVDIVITTARTTPDLTPPPAP